MNSCETKAGKRYRRRMLMTMGCYFVALFGASWMVRHESPHGWLLYFWSCLPAIPIMMVIVGMGRYLSEETDEYQKMVTIRSLLVGTGALLGTLVVNDFLRAFTPVGAIPPFSSFVIFCVALGIAQCVQRLRDRPSE